MDPIGEAAHTAFEEAIEGGADPAAALRQLQRLQEVLLRKWDTYGRV